MKIAIYIGKEYLEGSLNLVDQSTALLLCCGVTPPADINTLHISLLTAKESSIDEITRHLSYDLNLLGERLVEIHEWCTEKGYTLKFYGSSTSSAAALLNDSLFESITLLDGRPDLAQPHLPEIKTATQLLLTTDSGQIYELNKRAFEHLTCTKYFEVVS